MISIAHYFSWYFFIQRTFNLQVDGSLCTWRTVELVKDEVYWRDLRAIFPNEDAATKFHQNYLQGISYAQEWEIVDDIQSAEIEEID